MKILKNTPNIFEISYELLIKKFGLNDKNGYVIIKDDLVEEFLIEADNNCTISLETDKLNEATTIEEVLEIAAREMDAFDSKEVFNDICNEKTIDNSDYDALFDLVMILQADEKQFEEAAEDIRSYLHKSNNSKMLFE